MSSNGNSGGQHRQTHHRRADIKAGDVDNGAGEAGAAGDVFSHTALATVPLRRYRSLVGYSAVKSRRRLDGQHNLVLAISN